jgi:hypothetical protein
VDERLFDLKKNHRYMTFANALAARNITVAKSYIVLIELWMDMFNDFSSCENRMN